MLRERRQAVTAVGEPQCVNGETSNEFQEIQATNTHTQSRCDSPSVIKHHAPPSAQCQRSANSFAVPIVSLTAAYDRVPSLGRPGAYKRLLMFRGVVRVMQPGDDGLPYSSIDIKFHLNMLHKLATRQVCINTDPNYTYYLNISGLAVAAAVLGNESAWREAQQRGVIGLLGHCMEDCFLVSQQRAALSRERMSALLSIIESVWAFFWELLKLHTQPVMEDLCRSNTLHWLAMQVVSCRSATARCWASQIISRMSHMMHVSPPVTQHFVSLYPLLLQSNPRSWRTEEEQGTLLRMSSAVLEYGGVPLMLNHIDDVLGFCRRLARLEASGGSPMQYLLEYLVVAVLMGQIAATEEGREKLKHKGCSLALQEIATLTRRHEVAAVAWALIALPLHSADSVFGAPWWWGAHMLGLQEAQELIMDAA